MLPYWKLFPLQNVLLGAASHHLAFVRLTLHVLSCFAIDVTIIMHVHMHVYTLSMQCQVRAGLFFWNHKVTTPLLLSFPPSNLFQVCTPPQVHAVAINISSITPAPGSPRIPGTYMVLRHICRQHMHTQTTVWGREKKIPQRGQLSHHSNEFPHAPKCRDQGKKVRPGFTCFILG